MCHLSLSQRGLFNIFGLPTDAGRMNEEFKGTNAKVSQCRLSQGRGNPGTESGGGWQPRVRSQQVKKHRIWARGRGCSEQQQQCSELDGELPWGSHPSLGQGWVRPLGTQSSQCLLAGGLPGARGCESKIKSREPALRCSSSARRGSGLA